MPVPGFNLPSRTDIENSFNGRRMLNVIEGDFRDKSILITGCPGSGKTTVSIHRFIFLRNAGQQVALLTYQNLLRLSIQTYLSNQGIPTGDVDTLCKWYSRKTGGQFFYQGQNYHLPSAQDIYQRLRAVIPRPLHELIIDEGQDVHPKGYDALPHFATKITVGADDAQQVHAKGSTLAQIQNGLGNHGTIHCCELQYNYRNSYETYNFARQFVHDIPTANDPTTLQLLQKNRSGNAAEIPRVFIYHNEAQMKSRLGRLIENLQGRMAILLPKTHQVDQFDTLVRSITINGNPVDCTTYHSGCCVPSQLKPVLITTFMSAKGMEFDAVVMPYLHDSAMKESRRQCFVGSTRAIRNLYVFCHRQIHPMLGNFDPATYQLQDLGTPPSQPGVAQA
jgi:superfamily I DNA/RNA helicase